MWGIRVALRMGLGAAPEIGSRSAMTIRSAFDSVNGTRYEWLGPSRFCDKTAVSPCSASGSLQVTVKRKDA